LHHVGSYIITLEFYSSYFSGRVPEAMESSTQQDKRFETVKRQNTRKSARRAGKINGRRRRPDADYGEFIFYCNFIFKKS
jgi:hypothetical protein